MPRHAFRLFSILAITLALVVIVRTYAADAAQWPISGHDLSNSRNQTTESKLSPANVAGLTTKWVFTTGADVSATPTVSAEAVYFPDWDGKLYAVRRDDGSLIWSHRISEYDGPAQAVSRVSPAVAGDRLIIGDLGGSSLHSIGANVMALNRLDGSLAWITKVDAHPAAIITGSPVVVGDTVFVGVSSNEESIATDASYPCCSFRGSMVALSVTSGRILWQTYTMPAAPPMTQGFSGGAIWQSPAIDLARGTLYVGTGNNYEVPETVKNCVMAASTAAAKSDCYPADDYFDSALALDMKTGQIKWSRRLQGSDVWTVACTRNPNPVSCPLPDSPDYDFSGAGPNLVGKIVGFSQKSGMYWALNPDDGSIVWSTVVGPGSTLGGIEWGTATDAGHIYVAITNNAHKPYPLINGTSTTSGAWSALDAATGKILWQTADPAQGVDMGSVSLANGVLYAPSFSGNMHALDASTGRVLWTFASGGSVLDGPAIADGMLFWGSGYKRVGNGTPNNQVYAFGLP